MSTSFTHGSREASDQRVRELFDQGGYRALEELRAAGTVKAIGAGVNEWQVCETLLGLGDFDCFLLAGRYTLLEQEALDSFLPLARSANVGIILGGPFNSGILATGPVEGARYNYAPAPPDILARVAPHRGGLPRARREADRGGAAIRARPSGGEDGDPRRQRPDQVTANLRLLNARIPPRSGRT